MYCQSLKTHIKRNVYMDIQEGEYKILSLPLKDVTERF